MTTAAPTQSMVESFEGGVICTTLQGVITSWNTAAQFMFGYTAQEVVGQTSMRLFPVSLAHEEQRILDRISAGETVGPFDTQRLAKDGRTVQVSITTSPIHDVSGVVFGASTVVTLLQKTALLDTKFIREFNGGDSPTKEFEIDQPSHFFAVYTPKQEIPVQSIHPDRSQHLDPLTQLPNRRLLSDLILKAMNYAHREKQNVAIAYLDFDGFKSINDRIGHDLGDELLIALASNLRSAIRDVDAISRICGDEFALVLCGVGEFEEQTALINRILSVCTLPILIKEHVVSLTASIGFTVYPGDDSDSEQLLRNAEAAMKAAKQKGRNSFCMFDAQQHARSKQRKMLVLEATDALRTGELVLHFQPKVNMRTGRVLGMEALLRWQHPTLGLRAPADFLHLMESPELTIELGNWVLATALSHMNDWNARGLFMIVSINISPDHLTCDGFIDHLKKQLSLYPSVSPSQLYLEILESAAVKDIDKVSCVIDECISIGVHVMLDDFGTGYSSLSCLKHLRVDVLKIDRSFVRDMLHSNNDISIIKGVIGLAQAFGKTVIAEGMESEDQSLKLLEIGCDVAQGYLISRAMPPEKVLDWIENWIPLASWKSFKSQKDLNPPNSFNFV